MLESALCLLPMFAIFFGVIDVCYAVSIQSLLSQAVRAGSRWAVTYQSTYNSTTCSSQATCITQVVVDNAVGFLSANSSYIVVNYYVPPNLSTPVMSCSAGTCTASTVVTLPYTYSVTTGTSTTTVTISYANQPGNIVEVDIPAYPLLWMVPIKGYTAGSQVTNSSGQTGLGLSLSADAMDVLGNLPQGLTPPTP